MGRTPHIHCKVHIDRQTVLTTQMYFDDNVTDPIYDDVGLVTIWNDQGAYLSFWRSVFLRRAPDSLARVEELAAPTRVGQGTTTKAITDELLAAVADAYREAAAGRVQVVDRRESPIEA